VARASSKEQAVALIRNRILGHEEVPPSQLIAHSLNYRRHPDTQLEALRGSLHELGWVKSVIVSKRTGKIIDGHARIEEAIHQRVATIPVEYVDLTDSEERLALAILDPIAAMATQDDEALEALLANVETDDDRLQTLLADLSGESAEQRVGEEEPEIASKWQILIWCDNEAQQTQMLDRFLGEGLKCRALI
jgi:ParB-like chromosome segregation protein Spo0J